MFSYFEKHISILYQVKSYFEKTRRAIGFMNFLIKIKGLCVNYLNFTPLFLDHVSCF